MPVYRAQVILPLFTNLPEDVIVNQLHFSSTNSNTIEVAALIRSALGTFYTSIYGSTASARVNYCDWTRMFVKVFNLDDPIPRIPVLTTSLFSSAGTSVTTIPTEVACVLSFASDPQSGVRFQRLYNRIFLGALPNSAFSSSAADEFPRFTPTFTAAVTGAASNMLSTLNTAELLWRQVSDAGGTSVDRPVSNGWVDNSPDTQRRRSVLATLRNNWT